MAPEVKLELREGYYKTDTTEGMTCYVEGLDLPIAWQRPKQALDLLPQIGDANQYDNQLRVVRREITELSATSSKAWAIIHYEIPAEEPPEDPPTSVINGWRISYDSQVTKRTEWGSNGYYVTYGEDELFKAVTSGVEVQRMTLNMTASKNFVGFSARDANDFLAEYVGALNRSAWFGGEVHQWMCVGGSAPRLEGSGYAITLKFSKIIDPLKKYWNPILYAKDKNGKVLPGIEFGDIPAVYTHGMDAVPTDGVTIMMGIYDNVDFPFS